MERPSTCPKPTDENFQIFSVVGQYQRARLSWESAGALLDKHFIDGGAADVGVERLLWR